MSEPMIEEQPQRRSKSLRSLDTAFLPDSASSARLLLIRHGQAIDEVAPGDDDSSRALSPVGRKQAAALAAHLKTVGIDALYTSPFRRCRETAEEVARAIGLEMAFEPNLGEVSFSIDGPDRSGALDELRKQLRGKRTFPIRWGDIPGVEDGERVRERVQNVLNRIARAGQGKTTAVVTHGGIINAIVASVIGLEADFFFLPEPTSISQVVISSQPGGQPFLQSLNTTPHLAASHSRKKE